MGITRTSPTNELTTEPMRRRHLRRVLDIEEAVHKRPWTHRVFVDELSQVRSGSRSYICGVCRGHTCRLCRALLFSRRRTCHEHRNPPHMARSRHRNRVDAGSV